MVNERAENNMIRNKETDGKCRKGLDSLARAGATLNRDFIFLGTTINIYQLA